MKGYKTTEYLKSCPQCNNEYITIWKHQTCCSPKCAGIFKRKHEHKRVCDFCNKDFIIKRDNFGQKFCSKECEKNSKVVIKKCLNCNNEMKLSGSTAKIAKKVCCSRNCTNEYKRKTIPKKIKHYSRICKICNDEHFVNYPSEEGKYCSSKCSLIALQEFGRSKRNHKEVECKNCNKIFSVTVNRKAEYCSKTCRIDYIHKKADFQTTKCQNDNCYNLICTSAIDRERQVKKFCSKKCVTQSGAIVNKLHRNSFTKPEQKFWNILIENKIDFCVQYSLFCPITSKFKFYDFYLPNIDTLVEVDGTYWHGKNLEDDNLNQHQIDVRRNDIFKNQLAIDQNYKLIRIWEDEIDNFNFSQLKK